MPLPPARLFSPLSQPANHRQYIPHAPYMWHVGTMLRIDMQRTNTMLAWMLHVSVVSFHTVKARFLPDR